MEVEWIKIIDTEGNEVIYETLDDVDCIDVKFMPNCVEVCSELMDVVFTKVTYKPYIKQVLFQEIEKKARPSIFEICRSYIWKKKS